MTTSNSNSTDNKKYDRFFDGMVEICFAIFKIIKEGLKSKCYKKKENLILVGCVLLLSWVLIYKKHHYKFVDVLPDPFQLPLLNFLSHLGNFWSISISTVIVITGSLMLAGIGAYKLIRKYQLAIDHLNLKSGLGHRPIVVSVDKRDENRTKVLVKSTGLGEERYKTKLDDLRASVGQKIESVNYLESDNRFVEISLAHRILESKVNYSDLISSVKKPYSFLIGKSQKNIITENLEDVPHYLIAGSTGGGKSVAFKGMLLGLLESSKKINMYIFDFKQVEMNEFSVLPNVRVIKDEHEASLLLESFITEMKRRYEFLEKTNEKKIVPEKHNIPRIVIGIDECADLLGKVKRNDPKYEVIEKARTSLNELSRKARASGIHLIFATQKVDQNSIDTQIQENLEGRLSFRMNTIENSVRVLQNNMSYYLPSIPGRAIWKKGASYTEVQCPFISDDELKERIDALLDKTTGEPEKMIGPAVETKIKEEENYLTAGSNAE